LGKIQKASLIPAAHVVVDGGRPDACGQVGPETTDPRLLGQQLESINDGVNDVYRPNDRARVL
jgi:hypothetical protein